MMLQALLKEGLQCRAFAGMAGLCAALEAGAELAIVAEEVLNQDSVTLLSAVLETLPSWSDPPVIVLGAPNREPSPKLMAYLGTLANITVVERPTRPLTLLAVVRSALRARARQHETRELFEELKASREEISRHRDELADAVRRRTEELQSVNAALRLSERMAAIGTLSAGIGHDIANLLLPVRVHIDALEQNANGKNNGVHTSPSDHIPAIRACIGHLQRLSAGLRQMALDPDDTSAAGPGTEDTDLTEWWQTAEPVIRNTLPKGVRLEADIAPGLRASIAAHQLSQAIVNLVQNAGDAIASRGGKPGGMVRVWARPGREGVPPRSGQPTMWGTWPGEDRVRVGVTDDGPGMSEEVRRRCLEPLFTTKTRRLSTGLGLVLVKGIVQRAGGELSIHSDNNPNSTTHGTTFTLTLPIPAGARAARPKAAVTVRDPRFRGFISSTLKSLGYEPDPYSPELLAATTAAALSTAARVRQSSGTALLNTPTASSSTGHVNAASLGEACLWITDPDVTTPGDVHAFAASGRDRKVLVLGPGGLAKSSATALDDVMDRVVDFPSRPGPTQVREALSSLCAR